MSTAPDHQEAVGLLADLLGQGAVAVLSGAGLSTASGIPDYRGPSGTLRRHTPMTYQAFTGDPEARRRYWARSHLGWRRIAGASPSTGHVAVTRLQQAGLLSGVVTQNVDGLHTAAGTRDVVDLHGVLDRVVCLDCGHRSERSALDVQLRGANAGWDAAVTAVNPDGDVELADRDLDGFVVVPCDRCDGVLKPDVVFFGENVPLDRVAAAFAVVDGCAALLVLGSSLTVMSGYRFALRAAKLGVPVVLVVQGDTRADHLATLKVDEPLQHVLPAVIGALGLDAALATPG